MLSCVIIRDVWRRRRRRWLPAPCRINIILVLIYFSHTHTKTCCAVKHTISTLVLTFFFASKDIFPNTHMNTFMYKYEYICIYCRDEAFDYWLYKSMSKLYFLSHSGCNGRHRTAITHVQQRQQHPLRTLPTKD